MDNTYKKFDRPPKYSDFRIDETERREVHIRNVLEGISRLIENEIIYEDYRYIYNNPFNGNLTLVKYILNDLLGWINSIDDETITQNIAEDVARITLGEFENNSIIRIINESFIEDYGYFRDALNEQHLNMKDPIDFIVTLSTDLFLPISQFTNFCQMYGTLLGYKDRSQVINVMNHNLAKIIVKTSNSLFYFKKVIPLCIKLANIKPEEAVGYYMMFSKCISGTISPNSQNLKQMTYRLSDIKTIIFEYMVNHYKEINKIIFPPIQRGGSFKDNSYEKYLKYKTKYLKYKANINF